MAASADGTQLIVVPFGVTTLFTSSTAGASWTPREAVRQYLGAASSADGTRIAAAE
jgi:hypothetical protein